MTLSATGLQWITIEFVSRSKSHFEGTEKTVFLGSSPAIAVLLIALALLVSGQDVHAANFKCATRAAEVAAEDPKDAMLACEGVESALRFLQAQGLDVETDIKIEIVGSLNVDDSHAIAGHFDKDSAKAVILSYEEFAKFTTWLKIPITESLFQSVAAHEAAHIIAVHNFSIPEPTIQAQEYIAYVTTLATLEPATRAQVLLEYKGDGYDTDQQMNTTIYLCNPMRFGVEAYRHFVKKGRDLKYFRKILDGDVLND